MDLEEHQQLVKKLLKQIKLPKNDINNKTFKNKTLNSKIISQVKPKNDNEFKCKYQLSRNMKNYQLNF